MLLRFPTQPNAFLQLREDALERFRWSCRLPVIRQFGLEARDLGIYVTRCLSCDRSSAAMHAFSDLDPDLSFTEMEAELVERSTSVRYGWLPAVCPMCDAPEPQAVSAVYARYMPEMKADLHFELVFRGTEVDHVEYHIMSMDGSSEQIERPDDALAFFDLLGRPFSLRSLWTSFISDSLYSDEVVVREIQPGYYIGLRPYVETELELERMAKPFCEWMGALQKDGGWEVVTYLRDREDDDIPIPMTESYHVWLAAYATEITGTLLDPMIVVDSNYFLRALALHASRYGLEVRRDSGPDELQVRFISPDIDIRLNLGPVLFRIIHEGLTFERGIRRHFIRELHALGAAVELVPLLRASLPSHQIFVHRGQFVEIATDEGQRIGFADVVRIATAHDPRTPEGFLSLMEELAPGAQPRRMTLAARGVDGAPVVIPA